MTTKELFELRDLRAAMTSGQARQVRIDAGLSQPEVAKACGVSVPTICRWELRNRTPRGPGALRYARLLRRIAAMAPAVPTASDAAQSKVAV